MTDETYYCSSLPGRDARRFPSKRLTSDFYSTIVANQRGVVRSGPQRGLASK